VGRGDGIDERVSCVIAVHQATEINNGTAHFGARALLSACGPTAFDCVRGVRCFRWSQNNGSIRKRTFWINRIDESMKLTPFSKIISAVKH
jgi:hypothetical protein